MMEHLHVQPPCVWWTRALRDNLGRHKVLCNGSSICKQFEASRAGQSTSICINNAAMGGIKKKREQILLEFQRSYKLYLTCIHEVRDVSLACEDSRQPANTEVELQLLVCLYTSEPYRIIAAATFFYVSAVIIMTILLFCYKINVQSWKKKNQGKHRELKSGLGPPGLAACRCSDH